MEIIHLALKEYSHKERNEKIVKYLNSLNYFEISLILKKEFKGFRNYFYFAVFFNYVDIVEASLKHDADLAGHSLVRYAAKQNLTEMMCVFLQTSKHISKINQIINEVIFNNNFEVVIFMIKKLNTSQITRIQP